MKITSDYCRFLQIQCECILKVLKNNDDNRECFRKFNDICKRLSVDFLPPLSREDIAALSYSMLDIFSLSKTYCSDGISRDNDFFVSQIEQIKELVSDLFKKNKACETEIHRLMEINSEQYNMLLKRNRSNNQSAVELNRSISVFLKTALDTYYKNL